MKTPSSRPASLPLQFASSVWVAIIVMGLLGLGCASNNVNPGTAHRGTGYVDFYARNDTDLSWSIERLESDGDRKNVFFEFDPLQENILRLAFKPGHHRLSITIINRPILAQGTVELEVGDGQVIPVSVTLADAGTGQVLSVSLAPEVVDPGDVPMLEDLVLAALHDMNAKLLEIQREAMGPLAGLGDLLGGG